VRAHIKTFIIGRTRYCKISRNKIARKQTSRRAGCFFPRPSLSQATSCACEPVVQINGKKFSSGLYVQRSILDSLKCRPQVNLYPPRSPLLAYLVLHLRVGTQQNHARTSLKRASHYTKPETEKHARPFRCKTQCTAVSSHRDREPFCSSARNGF